jgi:WD40 repeat protein
MVLRGHEKRLSAIALDPAGSRCCTGSYDQTCKFWDFNGMNKSLQSFRSIEPAEGHQVKSISYNPTGGLILIACHKPEGQIHDRDGKKISQFAKGDPYRSDMIHTKGHIGPINDAHWHPTDPAKIISCAGDGTVRLWDAEQMVSGGLGEPTNKQLEVIKVQNNRGVSGKGVMVSTCAFSPDGKIIAAGTDDGNLQFWTLGASGMSNHNWSVPSSLRNEIYALYTAQHHHIATALAPSVQQVHT